MLLDGRAVVRLVLGSHPGLVQFGLAVDIPADHAQHDYGNAPGQAPADLALAAGTSVEKLHRRSNDCVPTGFI